MLRPLHLPTPGPTDRLPLTGASSLAFCMDSDPPAYRLPLTAHLPTSGRLLALDWGEVRTGLALSDETQRLASPLTTLTQRPGKRFPMPAFLAIVAEHQPVGLVIGLPLTLEGTEDDRAARVREIGTLVSTRSGLPCTYVDERLTTVRALRTIREMDGSTRGRKEDVDALAASLLLQAFLDTRRGGKPAYEGEERRGR